MESKNEEMCPVYEALIIPAPGRYMRRESHYPFRTMKPGECFRAPLTQSSTLKQVITNLRVHAGKEFRHRVLEDTQEMEIVYCGER